MNLKLTIEGDASTLARVLAALGAGGPVAASPSFTPPVQPLASGDPEDEAPLNIAAPAVDSTGLPWDERIHSGNKGLTQVGNWRRRKGVDDTLVAQVEAELRSRQAPAPVQQFTPPVLTQQAPPIMPTAQVPMPPPPMMPMQVPPTAPAPVIVQPPVAPVAPPPMLAPTPPQPDTAQIPDFGQFMAQLQQQFPRRDAAGQPIVTVDYLAGIAAKIAQAFGQPINAITDISGNPNMIAYAIQLLHADGNWLIAQ